MRTAAALCRDYGCTMVFSTATQPDFAARTPRYAARASNGFGSRIRAAEYAKFY